MVALSHHARALAAPRSCDARPWPAGGTPREFPRDRSCLHASACNRAVEVLMPRVLVCDDEAHITRTIALRLRKAGFVVETASNGEGALEALERNVPDLLISDCQMPGLDGIGLCHKVRADYRCQD